MAVPVSSDDFLALVRKSGLVENQDLAQFLAGPEAATLGTAEQAAGVFIRVGLLTEFQCGQILKGKSRGFIIAGKYRLLDHLGSGGMANVFLCEHISMRRRVALKVLPAAQATDPGSLERFYREARAVAALDHPNLVRAHDIDRDGKTHFLAMEYVDGIGLQDLVRRHGPLDILRACHYVRQVAAGLDQAHSAGIVHRDIKPGNLLLDRQGTVKILDMGLARFFTDDTDDTTHRYDENAVLGTADYCAPEQAMNSHEADIRADIYSLGATFYFLLTGQTPFGQGTTAQKIIWHQVREPTPLRELRPEIPEGLETLVQRMMRKVPDERFSTPSEVYEALDPWTQEPIPLPPEGEMPPLSAWGRGGESSTRHRLSPVTSTPPSRRAAPSSSTTILAPGTQKKPKSPRRNLILAACALLLVGGGLLGYFVFFSPPNAPTTTGGGQLTQPGPNLGDPQPQGIPIPEGMTITSVGTSKRVVTARYEATVDADGALSELKVGGVSVLAAGVPFGSNRQSRGLYLWSPKAGNLIPATSLEQNGPVLLARSPRGELRITCKPTGMIWEARNPGQEPIFLYAVFQRQMTAVRHEEEWSASPPAANDSREWKTSTWYGDRARVSFTAGTRIWGPWPDARNPHHVWQLDIPPQGSNQVEVEFGETTPEERTQITALTPKAPAPAPPPAVASLVQEGKTWRARGAAYEAIVEADGNLTTLRVDGISLLCNGGAIARGCYFFRQLPKERGPAREPQGTLRLPTMAKAGPSLLTASSEHAQVQYEFATDGITFLAKNTSSVDLVYFLVLSRPISSARGPDGKVTRAPVTGAWNSGTWLTGNTGVRITGISRTWGPWDGHPDAAQVLQVNIAPGKMERIRLEPVSGRTTHAAPAPAQNTLVVTSPQNWQVVQRTSRTMGTVRVKAQLPPGTSRVERRLRGSSLAGRLPDVWEIVPLGDTRESVDTVISLPAGGWYHLDLRASKEKEILSEASIEHLGVGEVFVGAGQSNSTNSGEERLHPESGRVSTFDGSMWRPADDPQPGTHDHSSGGSFWPPFGDAVAGATGTPVGVASTGHGGSSVRQWEPTGELFAWLMKRIRTLGPQGFRAVLWHQGEADGSMSPEEYERRLGEIIRASRQEAGWEIPWVVAQASYHNPSSPAFANVRAGQQQLWKSGLAHQGPDTDTLTGDYRDQGGRGIHFSGRGLRAHGRLWAESIGPLLPRP